jgi:DNA-binding XRE family transcriptional regulator
VSESLKSFPDLRGLLAKYNMTFADLAKVIGKSESSINLKMNNTVGFSLAECKAILNYFKNRGEKEVSADKIFFDWMSTIVDKEEAQ